MPVAEILSGVGSVGGLIQAIGGNRQEKDAENALQNLQTPTYTPSSSIMDYYNKALQRYSVNPYDSPLYKKAQEDAQRTTAMGITALQGGRNTIGGVTNLAQIQSDNLLKASAAAQQEQAGELTQLGTAASAKTNELDKAFKYNQLAPYEKQYNLLAMKGAGGANIMNTGLSNIYNGLGSASNALLANKIYGSGGATAARSVYNPLLTPNTPPLNPLIGGNSQILNGI